MNDKTQTLAVFLGVLTSDVGASNSIRNQNILSTLNDNFIRVKIVDFGCTLASKSRFRKILDLGCRVTKSLIVVLANPHAELMISTNPKWLVAIAVLLRKKFTLYLGDPFVGDVSRDDRAYYNYLWKACTKLTQTIVVFSPFLYRRLCLEYPNITIEYRTRDPITGLPSMGGDNILYLGDFSSKDRDFSPVVAALEKLDLELHLYGRGDLNQAATLSEKVKIFDRMPLSCIYKVIPNYRIMLIVLNRSGEQIPGKLFDFSAAAFPVLVLYEQGADLNLLPQPGHYVYCLNAYDAITAALHEIQKK